MTHLDFLTCFMTMAPMNMRAAAKRRPKRIASTVAAMLLGGDFDAAVGHGSPSARYALMKTIRTSCTGTTLSGHIVVLVQPLPVQIFRDHCRACIVVRAYRIFVVRGAAATKHTM